MSSWLWGNEFTENTKFAQVPRRTFITLMIHLPVGSIIHSSSEIFFKTFMTEASRLQSCPWQASCKFLYTDVGYPSGRGNSKDFFQGNFWKLFMLERETSSLEIHTFYQELSRKRNVFRDFSSKWKQIHSLVRTLARPRRCKFKYFLRWSHRMNKMHEQKPFTAFLHMSGEWVCCQSFFT